MELLTYLESRLWAPQRNFSLIELMIVCHYQRGHNLCHSGLPKSCGGGQKHQVQCILPASQQLGAR